MEQEKSNQKTEQLKKLDRKVRAPSLIFGYTFGTIGALIFSLGFCMALKVIFEQYDNVFIIGIILGVIGIILATINPYITKKIDSSRKKKYRDQVIALCDEIITENEEKTEIKRIEA